MHTGNLVISLTLDNVYLFAYAWIAFWTIVCAVLMVGRTGKNTSDWEIIGFRILVGIVCASVAIRLFLDPSRPPANVNSYTVFIAVSLIGLGFFSMRTTMRVIAIVQTQGWKHDLRREDTFYPGDETPDEALERRHQELVDTIPDAGRREYIVRPKKSAD
jgi:hypothetical protein